MATSEDGRYYRPADVRFYVDADILGLAQLLVQVRNDVTYPGDPGGVLHKRRREPCPVEDPATSDTTWLPLVTERRWLVISRDHNIRENVAERRTVREHGARMVALSGNDAGNTWGQLEVVMRRWRQIEELLDQDGPFIYLASRTVWRSLPLEDDPAPRLRLSPPTKPHTPRPRRRRTGDDPMFWTT